MLKRPGKRRPISNYEGYKRLDKAFEKIELRDRAGEKVCDVCHRRCRAWRIVPSTAGSTIVGFEGKFLVCCDAGPEGCAEVALRAGVHVEELRERELRKRLAAVGIWS